MKIKRVLVVDDLLDWRSTLKGLLTDEGFEVDTAGSVQDAEVIKRSRFDLALLDIRLDETDEGNVDGLNLAYEIGKIYPDMKIIMLTGYATIEKCQKGLEPTKTGKSLATDFIQKTETTDLLKIVQKLLSK